MFLPTILEKGVVCVRILVLSTDYPRKDESVSMMYVHTRNKRYVEKGLEVTVLNFSALKCYELDGVRVITKEAYLNRDIDYDILVSHAPNLRQHLVFLQRFKNRFKKMVFFFHGHEVLKTAEVYPPPYPFRRRSRLTTVRRNIYDSIKLRVWNRFFVRNANKVHFVFVSKWMSEMFQKYVSIDLELIKDRMSVIYNAVGKEFEALDYSVEEHKKYDFITIRSSLDSPKYCIDIVTELAKKHPQKTFCVVGKGQFFDHYPKPENLLWVNRVLSHREIVEHLNQSKCALMPTRADAQGVMVCEMATFGMPVITSSLEVCKEVFSEFINVSLIDNHDRSINLEEVYDRTKARGIQKKNRKYFAENTVDKEVELLESLVAVGQ